MSNGDTSPSVCKYTKFLNTPKQIIRKKTQKWLKTPNASKKNLSSPRRLPVHATYPSPARTSCHVPAPCHGCQGGGGHFSISTSVNGSYLPFFISRMHVPLSRACTVCHMPIGILTATFSPPGSITNESVQIRSSSS